MFDKFRWKLQRFMIGRNGTDQLCQAITMASLVIYILSVITKSTVLYYIGLAGIIYSLYRSLSKNIAARRIENQKFLSYSNFYKLKFQQRKEFKIFKCKTCGRNIRVPRKKGKIEVTCPVCGTKVIKRT